jgi:hypothetical protein
MFGLISWFSFQHNFNLKTFSAYVPYFEQQVLGRTNSLLSFYMNRKRCFQQFFFAAGTCLLNRFLATIEGDTDRCTDSPLVPQGTIENDVSSNSSFVACIRYRGNVFTQPFWGLRTQTHNPWEGFMKYTFEMRSRATLYIPSFIKTGSGVQSW